jgi:uncharacterized repeat protein (TIGR01451 family)
MDELYEEWLLATCDLDREKAARVRATFPRIDDLADATPEAIAESCGLSLEEALSVRAKASESLSIGDRWYSKKAELFICPSCGAFTSADSKTCPQCGTEFEEEEEEPGPTSKPAKEISQQPELYICSNCGAFLSRDARSCPTCHQAVEETEAMEEELPKEVVTQVEKEEVKVCPHCGAFLAPEAERCGICGYSSAEEAVPGEIAAAEIKEGKGVSRDFLARWQRVAEKTPTREDQLGEELRHYDELLEVDPKLERAWVLKSHVLRELGRPKEAAQCLEKAANINPARDEEYRLQVLNLAETLADSSLIPPRWSALAPPEKPAAEISAIQRALNYYERLLRSDPRLDVAWDTRAELLQRLGRNEEADISRARAKDVRRMKIEGERKALEGLRTIGVPRAKGKLREGRVNGLVNGIGRTNGLVNGIGRTNGLVNGIGRTNGLVNGLGRTNGLVNGIGRTNGLVNGLGRVNGLVNGIGHVNGLVNGNGFTNGRRGRFQQSYRAEQSWLRSAGAVAAIVTILLIAPVIATLFPSGPRATVLTIDGTFSDWAGIPPHDDAVGDTRGANVSYRSDLDLTSTKVSTQDGQLAVYVEVDGVMFETPTAPAAPDLIDYILVMVDVDGRPSTGYSIGGIGADMEVLISGYEGKLMGSRVSDWEPGLGDGQNNLSAFFNRDAIPAAASGGMLEFMMPMAEPSDAHIIVLTANTTGVVDIADNAACASYSTLAVTQRTLAGDIMTADDQAILQVRLRAIAGSSSIHSINVTKQGSMSDQSVMLSLHLDDNDGIYEPSDTLLNTSTFISGIGSLGVDLTIGQGENVSLFVVAHLTSALDASSLTLKVSAISTDSLVDLRDSIISGTYYHHAPNVTIDGVFGDWDATKVQRDGRWDVRSYGGLQSINTNVDIAEIGLNMTSELAVYLKVFGRMLGGEDAPGLRERPSVNASLDSDIDTVPDYLDASPNDFNNDGTTDGQTNHDVDGDGLTDYPWGVDYWLNTTIPDWFPIPYAGREVHVYIGPVSVLPVRGLDTITVYVDRDNQSDTGLPAYVDGKFLGFDFAYQASGRAGTVASAGLYRYDASRSPIPWEWVQDEPTAIDTGRLEASLNATVLNLAVNHTFVFFATDWRLDSDSMGPMEVKTRGYIPRPLSVAGDNAVINEVSSFALNLPPAALFTFNPVSPRPGQVVNFDATNSQDSDGNIVAYAWEWGDGTTGTGQQASHTYFGGTYLVRLTVTDNRGATATATAQITAFNEPPAALFTFNPGSPKPGQVVNFDATNSQDSDGNIVAYAWSYGDGTTGTGQQASHVYAGGNYTVTLVVTDNLAGSATATSQIFVHNKPPAALFKYNPIAPQVGKNVNFDATNSQDSDGDIVSYAWDFGDGTTGSGQKRSHAYAAGTYIVVLVVTDDFGATATETTTLTVGAVGNAPPAAMFKFAPISPRVGQLVTFDGRDSKDAEGPIASWLWDFGDGFTGTGNQPTHTYAAVGLYTVTMVVTDNMGATGTATAQITIYNAPPAPMFKFNPISPLLQQKVTFDGRDSKDSDGTIASWSWDFGDGTSGSGNQPTHAYSAVGTYTVTMVVTDNLGATATATAQITAYNAPPAPMFKFNPISPRVGQMVTFDGRDSIDSDGTILSWLWDFGDMSIGTGNQPKHAYAAVGTYTVTMVVTDNFGSTATATAEITVSEDARGWFELANPTNAQIQLAGWRLIRRQAIPVTLYTFTTESLGPWMSGSEYLKRNIIGLDIPDGGGVVIELWNALNLVVDSMTTKKTANPQTTARFKEALVGKPLDTDAAADWYVSSLPSPGAANDRLRPRITVAKVTNRATAAPGDTIQYTIYFNNTDEGRARKVWINDTLPDHVTYLSSSVPFSSFAGQTYKWIFTDVNPNTLNSFTITVLVNASAIGGEVLRNTAGLNYTDQLWRIMESSVATASTIVHSPVIVVKKIVDKADALPGDILTYTVFYNNTGDAVARDVWINDTLPLGVTYQSANPVPNQILGQTLRWHFTNVAVGSHSLTITVKVDANPPSILLNWVFLNYTSQNGYMLVGSKSSAITRIPEFQDVLVPIAIPLFVFMGRRFLKKKKRESEAVADSVPPTNGR